MDRYFDIFLRLPPPRARTHTSWSRLCFLSRHTSIFLSIDNWIECKGEEKNSFCFSRRYVQFWSNDVHSFFDENEREREFSPSLLFTHANERSILYEYLSTSLKITILTIVFIVYACGRRSTFSSSSSGFCHINMSVSFSGLIGK